MSCRCFKSTFENKHNWNNDSYNSAREFYSNFLNHAFKFYLCYLIADYNKQIPHWANYKKSSNISSHKWIEELKQCLDNVRNGSGNFWTQAEDDLCANLIMLQFQLLNKKNYRLTTDNVSIQNSYSRVYYNVLVGVRGKIVLSSDFNLILSPAKYNIFPIL